MESLSLQTRPRQSSALENWRLLPAVAETPAGQLGRHRGQDDDDSNNPWAGLCRPVALQFDGDGADEVPHTPAQEESPAALAANPFDGIFIGGTPPREDPADECAICQEAIGENDGWRWRVCRVPRDASLPRSVRRQALAGE